jgi:hypothetical protein
MTSLHLSWSVSRARGVSSLATIIASWAVGFVVPIDAGAATLRIEPTYENGGVYVEDGGRPAAELKVYYREAGAGAWLEAHALSVSSNDPTPRVSIFGLKPATRYEVRCDGLDAKTLTTQQFVTWSETPPIARTINLGTLAPKGGPVVIKEGGSAEGWVRYVATPGSAIDGGETEEAAILVEGVSHVILDGLLVRGGRRHGVLLKNANNVRIINCDIAGFGRVGTQDLDRGGKYYLPGEKKSINWDAGVYVDLSGNVTIERCFIHDPRGHANSWFYSHPEGPNAIFVRSTGGMVVRYNDFVGSAEHRWNDVIEGYGNGKVDGGFNRDSDIYGNYLAYANDDGIELDGGQCNVRFYGNKIEGGLCGISTAANTRGPSYIFDNLVVNLGDERGAASAAVKNGGGPTYSKGETFFWHNTFLTFGRGVTAVGFGSDGDARGRFRGHTRNNVFATEGPGVADPDGEPGNTYDHDVFASATGGPGQYDTGRDVEPNGVVADAGFVNMAGGLLALADGSAGRAVGERIAGLSAWQPAAGPYAAGVFSSGQSPMRPVAASLDRGQVLLVVDGKAKASQTVTLRSSGVAGGRVMKFQILKTDACEWLDVRPASGELAPGASLALSVNVDSTGRVGQGLLPGAAIVKFDNGDSLPLTVYLVASPGHFSRLYEAEALPGADGFATTADNGASAGAAIRLVDEQAGRSGKGARRLSLTVDVPAAGAYYVTFRVRTPRPYGDHDSMFVSVNGETPLLCTLMGTDRWAWSRLTGKTMHLNLQAGENRIDLIPREEIELDAILVGDRPLMAGDAASEFLTPAIAGGSAQ